MTITIISYQRNKWSKALPYETVFIFMINTITCENITERQIPKTETVIKLLEMIAFIKDHDNLRNIPHFSKLLVYVELYFLVVFHLGYFTLLIQ